MKKKSLIASLMVLFFIALVFGVTGCDCSDMNGGGTINTGTNQKATFAFQIKCDDSSGTPLASGMLQFNDHGENIKFHAAIEGVSIPAGFLEENSNEGAYQGTYTPQPKKLGEGGNFTFFLRDEGEGGLADDYVEIYLTGGIYAGYSISGNLAGGNIKDK